MRRRHQWSGCIVEEKASMRRRRDLDMIMKIIWGMLILITILIRKPTWIGPTFANNVPATRVAGAVVGAAERGRREVFVIQLSLSHGSLEWVVNDPSCILCHVGTVNFSSHQCNGHCINTHQTYCMAVSTGGVGALPGNWSPEFGSKYRNWEKPCDKRSILECTKTGKWDFFFISKVYFLSNFMQM